MANSLDGPLITIVAAWIVFLVSLTASRFASRSKKLPDHPNHRSSHKRVTSKAGGFAIMGGWLAGMFVVGAFSGIPETLREAIYLCIVGFLAFCLGVADDRLHLSPPRKMIGQIGLGVLFIVLFAPLQTAPIPFLGELSLGFAGGIITVFWIVAFMNAFNFMDGANGLAAGSAVVGLGGFSVIAGFGGAPFAAIAAFLLAVAAMGFMPSNLRRGRLFMGDNGSQAVSFLVAAFAVMAANASGGRVSIMVLPVIFMPLLFDVAWTLVSRLLRRQNVLTAHREHLYQLMMRDGATHTYVAVVYMTLTTVSTAAAILMLVLSPAYQWIAPAILVLVFSFGASRIYGRARRNGLFDEDKDTTPADGLEAAD